MITISAAFVANKSVVTKFLTRSLQTPLREIHYESLTKNFWLSFTHTRVESAVNAIKIESSTWNKYHKFMEKILSCKNVKPKVKLSAKKPLILLSAGSFLGYHKDGKVIKVIKHIQFSIRFQIFSWVSLQFCICINFRIL